MRTMEIPAFPRVIEIHDASHLVRSRLSQQVVLWPEQAITLAGSMCWPTNVDARQRLMAVLRAWGEGHRTVPAELRRIQHEWLRVGDVFQLAHDIAEGQHQTRRGGASLGKAVTLAAAVTRSWGTSAATFWQAWKKYKDVAHLVAATLLVCRQARTVGPQGQYGLSQAQLGPFQMIMMLPDLILAVALEFEKFGLRKADPQTLWQIPQAINVESLAPPARRLRPSDIATLNARRAGNRGKRQGHKTTPVFSDRDPAAKPD